MVLLVRTATIDDEDNVFQFLRANYYQDEPLNTSVNREVSTDKKNCPYLALLADPLSFLAVDEEQPNNILGLFLNKEVKKNADSSVIDKLIKTHENTVYVKVLKFIKYVNHEFDTVLQDFGKNTLNYRIFDVTIISVRQDVRRQNIAGKLMEAAINLAKAENYALMTIHCSSAYSASLAKRYGFFEAYKLPYKDYKDETGAIVFKPPLPHENFTVLVKELK